MNVNECRKATLGNTNDFFFFPGWKARSILILKLYLLQHVFNIVSALRFFLESQLRVWYNTMHEEKEKDEFFVLGVKKSQIQAF